MSFVDFEELKNRVQLSDAAQMLGLKMQKSGAQLRGACPSCRSGGPRALVITESKGWFCFAAHRGGDVIALTAHIRNVSVKDAAKWLADQTIPSTVPKEKKGESGVKAMTPLQYLEHDHDAVKALGFDPEFCKHHGIGYAGRGVARGHVLVPFRDEKGQLLGYIGVTDVWIPPNFMTNIVPFGKKSA